MSNLWSTSLWTERFPWYVLILTNANEHVDFVFCRQRKSKWVIIIKFLGALWWAQRLQYEEQLEECKKYKEFLVSLTPLEWFEEQAIAKAQRDAQRRDLTSQEGEICHQIRGKSTCILVFKYWRKCSFSIRCILEHILIRVWIPQRNYDHNTSYIKLMSNYITPRAV